jgi:Zinc dependent phospholipase C
MAYSVLTHEAIVDQAWISDIQPLLVRRFPSATAEDLRKAHAYAYGGAIIQDMGYYPFGSKLFTDLTHYVRSGDFVVNMLHEAQDLDEYAFALGSLAHFAADNRGHPEAINRAVPMIYVKLAKKFGPVVTYADDPSAHLKAEFAFDVVQVAQGNYAPQAYHDFIGFEVAKPVLERAFLKTYSIEMSTLFRSEDLALGTYRFSVSSIVPKATKAAWNTKKDEILQTQPTMEQERYVYSLSRADYEKEWGSNYERPGILARIISFVFRIIPKFGPFKALAFRLPPAPATAMFAQSFQDTLNQYRALLMAHRRGTLRLPNENFDLGMPTEPGKYRLADRAYATLVDKLHGKPISPELRSNILAFYSDLDAPFATKRDRKAWGKLLSQLAEIKGQNAGGASQE